MDLSKLVKDSSYHNRERLKEGEALFKRIFDLRTATNSRREYKQRLSIIPEVYQSRAVYSREEIAFRS